MLRIISVFIQMEIEVMSNVSEKKLSILAPYPG